MIHTISLHLSGVNDNSTILGQYEMLENTHVCAHTHTHIYIVQDNPTMHNQPI